MMKNHGAVQNLGSKKSKGSHASLSGGRQGSGGTLTSHDSSSRRIDRKRTPYDFAPTKSKGATAPSHESPPVRRGGAIPQSHESTPNSIGVFRRALYESPHTSHGAPGPTILISPEFSRTTNVVPMGGYMGLLNQMEPEGLVSSDEDLGEEDDMDDGEDMEEDGEATQHGSNSVDIPAYGTPRRPSITWVG